jgi:hypothetical protein
MVWYDMIPSVNVSQKNAVGGHDGTWKASTGDEDEVVGGRVDDASLPMSSLSLSSSSMSLLALTHRRVFAVNNMTANNGIIHLRRVVVVDDATILLFAIYHQSIINA